MLSCNTSSEILARYCNPVIDCVFLIKFTTRQIILTSTFGRNFIQYDLSSRCHRYQDALGFLGDLGFLTAGWLDSAAFSLSNPTNKSSVAVDLDLLCFFISAGSIR